MATFSLTRLGSPLWNNKEHIVKELFKIAVMPQPSR